MVTAATAPATEELNGMLQQQTPALISANVIAQQFGVEPQQLIDYCTANGIFVAALYNGGEYMVNFNDINDGFVRDFTTSLMAKTLEPQVQQRIQAIALLRNGTATAPTAGDPSDSPTEQPLETEARQAKVKPWKVGKKGTTMRETVINLIAQNDPSGEKGFLESLRSQDERATALVSKVIEKHYNNSTRSKKTLVREIETYLNELGGGDIPTGETATEAPKRQKRTRERTEQAAA